MTRLLAADLSGAATGGPPSRQYDLPDYSSRSAPRGTTRSGRCWRAPVRSGPTIDGPWYTKLQTWTIDNVHLVGRLLAAGRQTVLVGDQVSNWMFIRVEATLRKVGYDDTTVRYNAACFDVEAGRLQSATEHLRAARFAKGGAAIFARMDRDRPRSRRACARRAGGPTCSTCTHHPHTRRRTHRRGRGASTGERERNDHGEEQTRNQDRQPRHIPRHGRRQGDRKADPRAEGIQADPGRTQSRASSRSPGSRTPTSEFTATPRTHRTTSQVNWRTATPISLQDLPGEAMAFVNETLETRTNTSSPS